MPKLRKAEPTELPEYLPSISLLQGQSLPGLRSATSPIPQANSDPPKALAVHLLAAHPMSELWQPVSVAFNIFRVGVYGWEPGRLGSGAGIRTGPGVPPLQTTILRLASPSPDRA